MFRKKSPSTMPTRVCSIPKLQIYVALLQLDSVYGRGRSSGFRIPGSRHFEATPCELTRPAWQLARLCDHAVLGYLPREIQMLQCQEIVASKGETHATN